MKPYKPYMWRYGPIEVQKLVFTHRPLLHPKIETKRSLKLDNKKFFLRVFILDFVITIDIPKQNNKGKC